MKILINPGHGMKSNGTYDPGAVGTYLREADINQSIGRFLTGMLIGNGIEAEMFQSGDLSAVTEKANKGGYDYFISLHCNASTDFKANGVETLIPATGGKADIIASSVQAELVRVLGLRDRGVKLRPELYVLRNTTMPSILIEVAFISNPTEEKRLGDEEFLFHAALAIHNGFIEAVNYKPVVNREMLKKMIQDRVQFSYPYAVWELLDKHANPDEVYRKLLDAMDR